MNDRDGFIDSSLDEESKEVEASRLMLIDEETLVEILHCDLDYILYPYIYARWGIQIFNRRRIK